MALAESAATTRAELFGLLACARTERLRAAAGADPRLASRLGLWARRLVGEALSQARAIVGDHAALVALVGDEGVGEVFGRIIGEHTARMRAIHVKD